MSSRPAKRRSSAWPAPPAASRRRRERRLAGPPGPCSGRRRADRRRDGQGRPDAECPDADRLRDRDHRRGRRGRPTLDPRRRPRRLRRRLRPVRRRPRPGHRQGRPARRLHGLGLRPMGRGDHLRRHRARLRQRLVSRGSGLVDCGAHVGLHGQLRPGQVGERGLHAGQGHGQCRARPARGPHRHPDRRPDRCRHPGRDQRPDRAGGHARTHHRPRHHHRPSTSRPRPSSATPRGDPVSSNGSNGHKPGKKIRVAIVGVGNCASSLVQGRYYYENAKDDEFVPGLMHVNLGGYHIRDIEFVAAFDVDKNKVGKDLSEAIYQKPNNTYVFQQVPNLGVKVDRGMTHDGLGKYLSQIIEKAPGPTADVVGILKERKVDLVVSYLPVGSEEATKWYVEQALRAGVGFINAIPVFIGREPYWQRRFAEEGLPIIGDDIKSQVGATISHRVLTRLFMDRGVRLDRTYQLNFGGNTDFLNMLERERLESKKISKTNAVTSMLDYELDPDDVHVGPSDHVPWLKDRKWCYIRMEGTTYGDVPLNAELKLEVWDSPNSAGVITDAIRCLKLGLDRGLKGTLVAPSSYFMKSPPIQIHDDIARQRVEAFIRGEDNETLVGTENLTKAQLRKLASKAPAPTATSSAVAAAKKAAAPAR